LVCASVAVCAILRSTQSYRAGAWSREGICSLNFSLLFYSHCSPPPWYGVELRKPIASTSHRKRVRLYVPLSQSTYLSTYPEVGAGIIWWACRVYEVHVEGTTYLHLDLARHIACVEVQASSYRPKYNPKHTAWLLYIVRPAVPARYPVRFVYCVRNVPATHPYPPPNPAGSWECES
jgi:hypothetical protein